MKRIYIILITVLLVALPAVMPAATFWDGFKVPLGQFLGVVLTIFGVPLLVKLTRKAGLEITEAQAQMALDALINILVNIELNGPDADGKRKKEIAKYQAQNLLPPETYNILVKRYGDIDTAVQAAFEKSSLNKPVRQDAAPTGNGVEK